MPDYRLTCLFADRRHRREGEVTAAPEGARALIARADGGLVETSPQDNDGTTLTASFLDNATGPVFERAGCVHEHPKGKSHSMMRKVVLPS